MSINKSIEVLYCPCCNKRSHLCIFNVQRTALETENAKLRRELEAIKKAEFEVLKGIKVYGRPSAIAQVKFIFKELEAKEKRWSLANSYLKMKASYYDKHGEPYGQDIGRQIAYEDSLNKMQELEGGEND